MEKQFKPNGYNSVSPYFIVNGAQKLIDLLKAIFYAKELRRYDMPDGTIMHAEIQIDDSVVMLGDSSEKFPPVPIVIHVYVPDVDKTFERAVEAGCEIIEKPKRQINDPDKRGTFKDFGGNMWSIGTQL
jgi:PhnB protein